MSRHIIHRLSLREKLLVAGAAFAVVTAPIVLSIASAPSLRAQTAAPLAFEVASIKQLASPAGSFLVPKIVQPDVPFRISGSYVTASGTVTELILEAFNVKEFQISGMPNWASQTSDRYDIKAKAPGDSAPTVEQVCLMFQSLLADRFQLKLHRDSKQLPAYHLVISKKGSKLKPVPPDEPPSKRQHSFDQLVSQLSYALDRPVVDKTGLSGLFEYNMPWAQLAQVKRDNPDSSAIRELVEENLGLKLESARDQVVILVIDHVERPSEN